MHKCKCGNDVANNARTCPKCGHRFTSMPVMLLAGFFGVVIVGSLLSAILSNDSSNSSAPTPATTGPVISATPTKPPPTGFRNLKWGAPPNSSLKRYMPPTDEGLTMYTPVKTPAPLFDIPVVEEGYSFVHGRFFQGDAYLDGALNLQYMKIALIKTFGNPTFTNEGLKIWKWKWPKKSIEISLYYQDKFARTTVSFSDSAIN